ncbi:hypothetical protein HYU06_05315 [Candidatus Woesearchaeota archaeon]|nr:hypothetical protein [Candidatus Woesearchaeota archaeon]
MEFDNDKSLENLGEKLGSIFSYFLFTTMLFLILTFTGKLQTWAYFHVMAITLLVVLVGKIIKRYLQ